MSDASDPRVLYAAERTLLAWNRTSLSLIAFGFVIERFGLFLRFIQHNNVPPTVDRMSFWVGVLFVALGVAAALAATRQYRVALAAVPAKDIPPGYRTSVGVWLNIAVAVLGAALIGYLSMT